MVALAGDIQHWDNDEAIQLTQGRKARLKAVGNARQIKITKNLHLLDRLLDPAGHIPAEPSRDR
jgi:hypothetical protein